MLVHNTDPEVFRTVVPPGITKGLMKMDSDEWKYFDCSVDEEWKACSDIAGSSCDLKSNICTVSMGEVECTGSTRSITMGKSKCEKPAGTWGKGTWTAARFM